MLTRQVNKLARISILQRNKAFEKMGITGTQHSYILAVCREPGVTQDTLARKLYVNKSNVARQVANLCTCGYLTREPSESDRRAVCVYPTDKARGVYPEILNVLHDWNAYLLEALSHEEQEQVIALMARVVKRAADHIGERDFD